MLLMKVGTVWIRIWSKRCYAKCELLKGCLAGTFDGLSFEFICSDCPDLQTVLQMVKKYSKVASFFGRHKMWDPRRLESHREDFHGRTEKAYTSRLPPALSKLEASANGLDTRQEHNIAKIDKSTPT